MNIPNRFDDEFGTRKDRSLKVEGTDEWWLSDNLELMCVSSDVSSIGPVESHTYKPAGAYEESESDKGTPLIRLSSGKKWSNLQTKHVESIASVYGVSTHEAMRYATVSHERSDFPVLFKFDEWSVLVAPYIN